MRKSLLYSLLLAAGSCAAPQAVTPPPAAVQPSPTPVISRIVSRNDVIVIRAGQQGATYSLETKTGEVLIPGKTMNELAQSSPQFHNTVRTMQASTVYAGVDAD